MLTFIRYYPMTLQIFLHPPLSQNMKIYFSNSVMLSFECWVQLCNPLASEILENIKTIIEDLSAEYIKVSKGIKEINLYIESWHSLNINIQQLSPGCWKQLEELGQLYLDPKFLHPYQESAGSYPQGCYQQLNWKLHGHRHPTYHTRTIKYW